MILDVLKLLASPVVDYFGRKQEIKAAKHSLELSRITRNEEASGNLDLESIRSRGWKDDYLLILTTLPLLVIFVEPLLMAFNNYNSGSMTVAVFESFKVLETAPDYYWYVIAGIYIDTFGFRRMLRVAVENWLRRSIKNN